MPWQELSFQSAALRDNPLGDPHVRPLFVWTPPSYEQSDRRYPCVYLLQGFTGTVRAWFNVRPWQRSFPEQVDALAPEAVVVLLDAFTALGGSQFLDTPTIGRYHTYLCDEVVPFVDAHFRTSARALQGHSSGGFGAMVTAMLRPDLFAGFATHAGDALFETSYQRNFAETARALRDRYDGSYEKFWDDFRSGRAAFSKPDDATLLDVFAMAASYSEGELPFDVDTGELRPEVWAKWLAWDPVRMAREERYAAALRGMIAIWIDAGRSDEYFLELGSIAFRQAVAATGVPGDAVRFELFDGGHTAAGRYPLALAFLAERLGS